MTDGDGCVLCELNRALRARSGEIRGTLQEMNPATDPSYDRLFCTLVAVDKDLRRIIGHARPLDSRPSRRARGDGEASS